MALNAIPFIVQTAANVISSKLRGEPKQPYELTSFDAESGKATLAGNPDIKGIARGVNEQLRPAYENAISQYIRTGSIPEGFNDRTLGYLLPIADQIRAELSAPPVEDEPPPTFFDGEQTSLSIEGGEHLSPIGVEDYFVPNFIRSIPGGHAGFAQQTPAGQRQMFGGNGGGPRANGSRGRRAKRSLASNGGGKRRTRKSSAKRGKAAKFIKGSAAAKRHMARLRAMRK